MKKILLLALVVLIVATAARPIGVQWWTVRSAYMFAEGYGWTWIEADTFVWKYQCTVISGMDMCYIAVPQPNVSYPPLWGWIPKYALEW